MSQDGDQSVTSVPRSTVLVDIDYDQVSDYINLQGLWATATTLPPDYYFGDLIEAVIEAAHPPEPRPAFPPGPHYLPLKIAILGPSFSGKHSLAKALQERYGIRPIELKPIITDAIKAVEKRMEPEDPKKRKQQEEQEPEVFMQVAEQLYAVKEDIPDTIKAEILRARLRGVFGDETKTLEELEPPSKGPKKKAEDTPKKNSHGIAILGYPTTLSEAKELERVLSGFIHPSDLPEPLSSVKLKEAALLITPSEKQPPQPELERSFFDIVFWLDGNLDNIILRSTQRRVDASGNVWNLTFNPPPDNLLAKVKVIDDPEHTPEKLTAKYREFEETQAEVYSWLQLFGYQSCQEKLLELVETDVGLKESVQKAVNKIEKVLKLKDENPGLSSTSARSRFSSTRLFASQTIELPQNIAISLNSTFEKMKNRYLSGVNSALKALPEVNMKASYLADAIKSDYKEFLSRSDTKQEQLTPFLQALNSLIASKPYIPSAEKQEIFEQIEEVSDQLWEIIAGRKDEAVLERQRVIDSTPYVGLYAEAMEVGRELMQAEALWMYTAVNVEKEFNASVLGKTPCEKLNLPVLSLNLKKRPESEYGSCTGAKSILSTLKTQLLETAPQEDDIQCFSSEMTRFEGRLNIILEKVCGVIDEIGKNEHETCEVLDDWIVDAVKWENDCVNEIVRARQLSKAKDAVNSHTAIKAFQLPNGSEVQTHLR